MSESKKFKSEKSGLDSDYLHVTMLPTGFRSYKEKSVWVRGLYFEEVRDLSKYIGTMRPHDVDYAQIVNIYSDAVRGIPVEDLEPIDLQVLMIISSIWTVDNFGWNPKVPCPQVKKDQEGHEEPCTGVIEEMIVLDDFDFKPPKVKRLPIPITISGKELKIGALTVGGRIDKQLYLRDNPDVDPVILDYAEMIKNEGMTLEEKINIVRFGDRPGVMQIKQLDDELLIEIEPVMKACNVCHKKSRVEIGLDQIKAYP